MKRPEARQSMILFLISDCPRKDRWQYILNSNTDKLLWKAVDWNGGINQKTLQCTNDNDFKENLECLLNPEGVPELNVWLSDGLVYTCVSRPHWT